MKLQKEKEASKVLKNFKHFFVISCVNKLTFREMWCSNPRDLTIKKCDNYGLFRMPGVDLQPYCNFIAPTSVSSHEFSGVHKTKFIRKTENFAFF